MGDSKWHDIEFNDDDLVFLKLHPYRQQIVFKRASPKLAHRFYKPFAIEKRISKVAYQLQLLVGSRIHLVFQVSLFKKKIGDSSASCPTLPPLNDNSAIIIEPKEIIDTRWIKKGGIFLKKAWSNGNSFPLKMPLGRML
ncbi:hypothetical protein Patl1_07421 [Pistacia atlantica]|uniref:Uncharacterized protein n=1 Tax=Pistacia atlantica TaxID=434234 RepID=A0ACC1AD74_9ROSI|nr:hypothetical protein Patl1_07421 [Pistacia atlantica]